MIDEAAIEESLRQYAHRFTARDRDGWLDLFAETPEIIEPADSEPRRGRYPLEEAFDGVTEAGVKLALEPLRIIVNGADGAMHMQVTTTMPDGSVQQTSVIEIFTFEPGGKICKMRAFLPT